MLTITSKILNEILDAASLPLTKYHFSIQRICHDSRLVKAGDLFVAIPCEQVIVHTLQAIDNGAVVIVGEASLKKNLREKRVAIPFIISSNPSYTLAQLASAYYPDQPETMVAVTGTNGKSSVVSFLHQLWTRLGYASASMGTLGLDAATRAGMMATLKLPQLTTPDALSFHQALHVAKDQGITHMAFEASSHGLQQYRVHGVRLTAAALTNLSHEHLDYHKTFEAYGKAKEKLFTEILPTGATAVVCRDIAIFDQLALQIQERHQKLLTYSLSQQADFQATQIEQDVKSVSFTLYHQGKSWGRIYLKMPGHFQVENVLCTLALLTGTGIPLEDILPWLETLRSVPGRMEFIGQTMHKEMPGGMQKEISEEVQERVQEERQGGYIYVDYSHSPDALQRALQSLRHHTKGKLWVIFGCGGNRDKEKRYLMGHIAHMYADEVIITDDNPRFEDPALIRAAILKGCPRAYEIGDRAHAIHYGITHLQLGDALLVAGKGHEQGQIIQSTVLPFDDKQTILGFLKE